jgi:hypothetical protein
MIVDRHVQELVTRAARLRVGSRTSHPMPGTPEPHQALGVQMHHGRLSRRNRSIALRCFALRLQRNRFGLERRCGR